MARRRPIPTVPLTVRLPVPVRELFDAQLAKTPMTHAEFVEYLIRSNAETRQGDHHE